MIKRALFIFRRDLRLQDNLGLIAALKESEEVILAFIFTLEQTTNNSYRSDRSLQFMIESLKDLNEEIIRCKGKLYLFYGEPTGIIERMINELHIEGVFVNEDYTPYSIQRDHRIKTLCQKHQIYFKSVQDLTLHPIEETLKSNGLPYTIFTPFYKNALKLTVAKPTIHQSHHYFNKKIAFSTDESIYETLLPSKFIQRPGGRKACLSILENLNNQSNYELERDFPVLDNTTHLSPHLKFTTCSPREIYHAIVDKFGVDSALIRSLYWRDFFTSIGFYFPHVFGNAFQEKFNNLLWSHNQKNFNFWCEGKTGFPIIDAGMRELNQTGHMQNRVRMLVANFLIKDLHIDWQWGEKYFATHLIDFDPCLNNGNWQWAASTGCDAQPYFRIFNPWIQAKKFDPECLYIKKWVPELKSFSPEAIHKWFLKKFHESTNQYPPPMLDHSKESAISLNMYKNS